jgi:hypothetical protein
MNEQWEMVYWTEGNTIEQPFHVWRFPVPGGWIYATASASYSNTVFVPEPKHAASEE